MSRILVVDDDETMRILVNAHLKKTGHRVLVMESAEAAITSVTEHGPPDLAVLDVTLPGMDGFELAQKLRMASGRGELPIIFLSGSVDQEHIDRGRDLGAVYLTKPYIRSALCNAIDQALPQLEGW